MRGTRRVLLVAAVLVPLGLAGAVVPVLSRYACQGMSRSGELVLSGEHEALLVSLRDGSMRKVASGFEGEELSRGADRLLGQSGDARRLSVLDLATGAVIWTLPDEAVADTIEGVAISPSGDRVALIRGTGEVPPVPLPGETPAPRPAGRVEVWQLPR